MLARRALSKPQLATLVRRNCVTFQPTAHDRAELRAAGADDAVLAAIDQCLRARLARAAPPPRPVAPAPARPTRPAPAQRPSRLGWERSLGPRWCAPTRVHRRRSWWSVATRRWWEA